MCTDKHYIRIDIHPMASQTTSDQWHTQTHGYSNAICTCQKYIHTHTCTDIVRY